MTWSSHWGLNTDVIYSHLTKGGYVAHDKAALPTRLVSEPIVDVICEVRFEGTKQVAVNVIPGLLFEKFGDFESIEKLALSELPEALIAQEAFKYQPHIRLKRDNHYISVGPNMLSASCLPPYGGWQSFKAYALDVISVLKNRKFIDGFTRVSLRYTDIISINGSHDIGLLNAEIRLGDNHEYKAVQAKLEREEDGVYVVTQVVGPAQSSDGRKGLIVDVDTICDAPSDFWHGHEAAFDKLHKINKRTFFEMLKPTTIAALGPEH